MNVILAVPVLVSGYALLSLAALTGAMVLAWDGAHLFLSGDRSQKVLHQRRYATSMTQAMTSLVGVLVAFLVAAIALVATVTVAVGFL